MAAILDHVCNRHDIITPLFQDRGVFPQVSYMTGEFCGRHVIPQIWSHDFWRSHDFVDTRWCLLL